MRTWPEVPQEEFMRASCVGLGPFEYEDFDEALSKLGKTGMVW